MAGPTGTSAGTPRVLPEEGLPATGYPRNVTLPWFSGDTRENFLALKSPGWGEGDIGYAFNEAGYRCPPFAPVDGIRIVAIGCSYAFGVGLPAGALFHAVFGGQLAAATSTAVTAWNLSMPGVSNDYIARLLHLAVPALNPHVVLVNFTHADRREYLSSDGVLMPVCTGWHPEDRVGREIKELHQALASPGDDDLNLFRNYKSVASLLAGRPWVFSTIAHPLRPGTPEEARWGPFVGIRQHVDGNRYAGTLGRLDLARDGTHPGPASHRDLAARCWASFCTQDGARALGV